LEGRGPQGRRAKENFGIRKNSLVRAKKGCGAGRRGHQGVRGFLLKKKG